MPVQKVLIVCDRGTLDNKAYMTDLDFACVLDSLGCNEVELRDEDEDEVVYAGAHGAFADDDLDMGMGSDKDVDLDEAADAGFEIQDEDDVFGDLLNVTDDL